MPIALITGASRGLGRAVTHALAGRGWTLIADARRAGDLTAALHGLAGVTAIAGDVTDPGHRARLAAAVASHGRLDLLVNNASRLGPSPQLHLRDYPLDELARVYDTDVIAPLALIQLLAGPLTAAAGTVVNISSDAAVEAYPGWGGYGSAKAALDQLTSVLDLLAFNHASSPSNTFSIERECILPKSIQFESRRGSQPCGSRSIW